MRSILFFGLLLVVCCVGCAQQGFTVGGKVTFEDGTAVPRGEVTLVSSTFTAGGQIAADGTYNINARVPAGTYQIAVRAMGDQPATTSVEIADKPMAKPLVDLKYGSAETSKLSVEVKGKTIHNITVEAPK
jgi:hypothetical protein